MGGAGVSDFLVQRCKEPPPPPPPAAAVRFATLARINNGAIDGIFFSS
jgi:hypothetical protein